MRRAIPLLLYLGMGLLLSAYQQQQNQPQNLPQNTVTAPKSDAVDQARQQTIQLKTDNFVPPPRRIDDIVSLLEQVKPPTDEIAKRRATADAEPPAGLQGPDLAEFYWRRSLARSDLGRTAEAITDGQRAVDMAKQGNAPWKFVSRFLASLSQLEAVAGRCRDSLNHRLERAEVTPEKTEDKFFAELLAAFGELCLGDLQAAQTRLERAERKFAKQGSNVSELQHLDRERTLEEVSANLALNRGDYSGAETAYRVALIDAAKIVELYASVDHAALSKPLSELVQIREAMRRQLARALALEGKLAEAEAAAREALMNELSRAGADAGPTTRVLETLAWVIAQQNRHEEAEKLSRLVVDMRLKSGLSPSDWSVVGPKMDVAQDLVSRGHWRDAMVIYDAVAADFAKNPEGRERFLDRNIAYASALVHAGQGDKALAILDRAVAQAEKTLGKTHRLAAAARGQRAVAYEVLGRHDAALADFQTSIPILVGTRLPSGASEQSRVQRFILQSYLHLLSAIKDTPLEKKPGDAAAEAFRMADYASGQSVQQAVANAVARLHITDPNLADLARREQDAGQNVAALEGILVDVVASPEKQRDSTAIAKLRQNIEDLRQAQATLRQEIEHRFPDYAALIDPKPPTLAQVQAALHPGEAFVSSYSLDDRTLIWAIPKEGAPVFAIATVKRADLAADLGKLRNALDPEAATLADIPPFDVAAAHALYAALLEPAQAGWKDAKSLVITSDWLSRVPAGLLVTQSVAQPSEGPGKELFGGYRSVPFLVRQFSVSQVPSAATLVTLRALAPGNASRRPFVGFGDPVFNAEQAAQEQAEIASGSATQQVASGETTRSIKLRATAGAGKSIHADLSQAPRLPDTAQELREVALALKADPKTDLFLGPAANEHQVETMKLDDRRVVMFATHGLVPGDLDGLTQPALALSAPALSGTDGNGLLTMEKIMALKLDADWVVLSACNTSAGEESGAEAVSGLGRAFFYAGARSVVVTSWPVETMSARLLTTGAFRHQTEDPALNRAEALRRSEVDLIDRHYIGTDGKAIFSYAHPIFWAPFALVGDEG